MKRMQPFLLVHLLLIVFALPKITMAIPLEPGIGIPGDFEVGIPFFMQLDRFRAKTSPSWDFRIYDEPPYILIPSYSLRFRLSQPGDILTLIVCDSPDCVVYSFGLELRVGDRYDKVADVLGRPTEPHLKYPQDGIGRVWYYDDVGAGFDINRDGFIRAILIYPRRR